tara:strand:+ start:10720 stop:10881 length:162 start_codon:yes stop_codon:yes gene_type:complete
MFKTLLGHSLEFVCELLETDTKEQDTYSEYEKREVTLVTTDNNNVQQVLRDVK